MCFLKSRTQLTDLREEEQLLIVQYRLYVDEVGNDDLGHVADDELRYLSLTGVAMHQDQVNSVATPRLNVLKASIFRHDPDDPLIFHRSEIVKKSGPFGVLADPVLCKRFDDELIACLTDIDYTVITAVIDKKAMVTRGYWRQNHPTIT